MYGLVLAGGGGKGGYHIGVWKALREMQIKIDAVTGTSVGSLNGALIVQDDYEVAINLWSNLNVRQVLNVDSDAYQVLLETAKAPSAQNIRQSLKSLEQVYKQGGLDIAPLVNLIHQYVKEDVIRASHIAFGLVTVCLTDKKPLELFVEDIPEGKLADYMLASSFLPGFMPMELDGKHFIDGAFHDNLPINLMMQKNIDHIIAVNLDAIGLIRPAKRKDIIVINITPSGPLANLLEFDAVQSKRDLQMGYLDTMKTFGSFSGIHYYLKDLPDESIVINHLNQMPIALLEPLFDLLKLDVPITKRMVFERLIPSLAHLFDVDDEDDYMTLLITIFEYMAQTVHLERLTAYTYEDFIHHLHEALRQGDVEAMKKNTQNPLDVLKERLGLGVQKFEVGKIMLTQRQYWLHSRPTSNKFS